MRINFYLFSRYFNIFSLLYCHKSMGLHAYFLSEWISSSYAEKSHFFTHLRAGLILAGCCPKCRGIIQVTVFGGKWNYKAVAEHSRNKKIRPIFMRRGRNWVGSMVQGWFLRESEQSKPRKISYFILQVSKKALMTVSPSQDTSRWVSSRTGAIAII